jgi:hypothetical protein
MCDCVSNTNKSLREKYNSELITTIGFVEGQPSRIAVATEKADTTKRGRPIRLVATFCPFCDEKYPAYPEQMRQKEGG